MHSFRTHILAWHKLVYPADSQCTWPQADPNRTWAQLMVPNSQEKFWLTIQKSYIQTITLSVSKSLKHFLLNKTNHLSIVKSQDLIWPWNFSDPHPTNIFHPNCTLPVGISKTFYPEYTFHRCWTYIHCVFAPTVSWLNKYYMRSPVTLLHDYCTAESKNFLHVPYFTVGNFFAFITLLTSFE